MIGQNVKLACSVLTILLAALVVQAQTLEELELLFLNEERCNQGDLPACNSAAIALMSGGDAVRSAQLLGKACDGGLQISCSNLAEQYVDGLGVEQNYAIAFTLFKEACGAQIPDGCAGGCVLLLASQPNADDQISVCQNIIAQTCTNGNQWMCKYRDLPRRVVASFQPACTESVARVVGQAYWLSNPLSEGNLGEFLGRNNELFVANGHGIRCTKALGEHLIRAGNSAYDPNAYERAAGVGPIEFAGDVADSINSGSVDLFMMGKELVWLSNVLPAAAHGNFGPLNSTGTPARQQIRQVLPIYAMMMQDPEMRAMWQQIVQPLMRAYGPMAVDQIVMLSLMMPE